MRLALVGVAATVLGTLVSPVVPASYSFAHAPTQPSATSARWMESVNAYRSMSGLDPVTEAQAQSAGAALHSCYMLRNGISHDEVAGNAGYTTAGDVAGNNGNVAVTSAGDTSDRTFVDLWMTGPFHAIGMLRPGLRTVGYGRCDRSDTPQWHSGATIDVIDGLADRQLPRQPVLFPGDGATTRLDRFVAESPDPLDACGWSGPAGLPVLAMLPESTAGATATISGPGGPLQICTLTGANTSGESKELLDGDRVVVAIPRLPLLEGEYHVTIHTDVRVVAWSFVVDRSATLVQQQPIKAAGERGIPAPTLEPWTRSSSR